MNLMRAVATYRMKQDRVNERQEFVPPRNLNYQMLADKMTELIEEKGLIITGPDTYIVGERVEALTDYKGKRLRGLEAKVVCTRMGGVGVEFNQNVGGSTCHGYAESRKGMYLPAEKIRRKVTTQEEFNRFLQNLEQRVLNASEPVQKNRFAQGDIVTTTLGRGYDQERIYGLAGGYNDINFFGYTGNVPRSDVKVLQKKFTGIEPGDRVKVQVNNYYRDGVLLDEQGNVEYIFNRGERRTGIFPVNNIQFVEFSARRQETMNRYVRELIDQSSYKAERECR
jgi:hypothetical protein